MPIKTTIITGATSGIGKETALALAKKDHAVYMLVRDTNKGEQIRKELIASTGNKNIYIVHCDLADLKTVKTATEILKEKLFAINVLINNAGGLFPERQLSKDGYEITFAVNHLGHFLLTMELMPLLERGQARIINVSSEAHRMGRADFDNLQAEKDYSSFKVYGTAKLYNIYFAKSLAEKYQSKGITSFALHPGVVKSDFWVGAKGWIKALAFLIGPFMISPEEGAQTSIYLATTAKLNAKSGQYFKNQNVAKPAALADNKLLRDKLWKVSNKLTEKFSK